MDPVIIRFVSSSECKILTEIGRVTFQEAFGSQNEPSNMQAYLAENFSFEQIACELSNLNSHFYFAEIEREIVGYLKVNMGDAQTEDYPSSLEIERIYVKSSFQGQGIGQILMNKAIEIGSEKELGIVWLGVWDQNREAIRFYERNGFTVFDSHQFMLGNDRQTDVLMRKKIAESST